MQIEQLVAIPEDGFISVDGQGMTFSYNSPLPGVKAVQWAAKAGQLEYYNVSHNQGFDAEKYNAYVSPFVSLWQAERNRQAEEAAQPPSLEQVIAGYEARIQARLDGFVRTLTYDSMLSACTYATSTITMYRIEGQYCVDARDATWAKAYELMSAILPTVQAGGAIPAWEEIEAQLPPLTWPEGSRGYVPGGGE